MKIRKRMLNQLELNQKYTYRVRVEKVEAECGLQMLQTTRTIPVLVQTMQRRVMPIVVPGVPAKAGRATEVQEGAEVSIVFPDIGIRSREGINIFKAGRAPVSQKKNVVKLDPIERRNAAAVAVVVEIVISRQQCRM